jgi:hypothetical protein
MEPQGDSLEEREDKKRVCEVVGVGRMGEYLCEAKVYSCFFARARGLLNYLFFF